MKKIVKSGGHCYDGTGWCMCPFYKAEDGCNSRCLLFGGLNGVNKNGSKALNVCDKVYGMNYEGNV